MSNNVNVNFKVSGGDISSYMDNMKQKADQLSSSMIENAKKESGAAKDQLKSYEQQIAILERKARLQTSQATTGAELSRASGKSEITSDLKERYAEINKQFSTGKITQRKATSLREEALEGSHQRTEENEETYKDQLKRAKDEHRDSQTLIRTMRENVDTVKSSSQQQLGQMRRGDEALVDAVEEGSDPSERLANQLASQTHIEEQAKEDKKKGDKEDKGVFGGFLKALAFERVGGMVAQMPSARNELEFAKPMMAAAGMALGGLLGSLGDLITGTKIAGFGVGQTNFGAIGAQFGEKMGEFAGSAIERSYKSRDELTASSYRLQALTGTSLGVQSGAEGGTGLSSITADLKDYGSDFKETSELQLRLAQTQGTRKNLAGGVENVLAAEAGLGVTAESFMGLTELLRSSSKDNKDVLRLIGGVATAGKGNIFKDDRTFLNEFLTKNFSQLQKTLLQTQNTVASGTTFDILKKFNEVGGPFAARDSRSSGLINTVQGALVNPGSDNLKALSTMMLRREMPGKDFFDIEKEKQKGLGSSTYLKSMFGAVESIGGNESMKKMNLANVLGLQGNLSAVDLLYKNKEKLASGQMSAKELMPGAEFQEGAIRELGKGQVSPYAKSTAEIENAYIEDAVKGITTMGTKMAGLFGTMMDGVAKYVDERVRGLTDQAKGTAIDLVKNGTKTPTKTQWKLY